MNRLYALLKSLRGVPPCAAIALICACGSSASAATVVFNGMTNDVAGYNEPEVPLKLAEAQTLGLTLSVFQGVSFNVGCGGACLGADLAALNDFTGDVEGLFSIPVGTLSIDITGVGSVSTMLFDVNDNLIATLSGDVSYLGANGAVMRFETDFTETAFASISFTSVPEPGSFGVVLATGLVATVTRYRRGQRLARSGNE